jgi:hypothetical protein
VSHFVTGSSDNSRDFQDFLLELVVKLARLGDERHEVRREAALA